MKNNDSIKLSDIVQVIGIILLGAIVFISMNYQFVGNLGISISSTLLTIVLYYFVVFLMAKFKSQKEDMVLYKNVERGTLVFVYVPLIVASVLFANHFLYIENTVKADLKLKYDQDISTFREIMNDFSTYRVNQAQSYKNELQNNADGDVENKVKGFSSAFNVDETLIQSDLSNFADEFSGLSSYNYITSPSLLVSEPSQNTRVQGAFDRLIDKYAQITLNHPNEKYVQNEPFKSDKKASSYVRVGIFDALKAEGASILLAVIIALIINAMILWAYFAADRAGITPPEIDKGTETGITL